MSMRELTIDALTENLPQVLAMIDGELEAALCPMKTQVQIDIAVEEIFVNVARYAYSPATGKVTVRAEVQESGAPPAQVATGSPTAPPAQVATGSPTDPPAQDATARTVTITFIDSGVPYDPLAKEDPDVTLSDRKRRRLF